MAFDPDAFLAEPSGFDPDAFLQAEQPILATMGGQAPDGASATDYGQALISGANVLAPSLAGLPVDTARNIANLGIAGYGVARKEIGEAFGEEGYIPPETLPPQVGGSEWMRQKMAAGTQAIGGGDPFAMADPTDPTQQKLHMAGSILASGALAPSTGIKQAALNVAKMGVPAAGAVGMQEAFPDQPLAPLVGMMAAPAGMAMTGKAKAAVMPKVEATKTFIKAHKMGYKVPPAQAKPNLKQNIVEGFGGTTPVSQKASLHNQKITNALIKKDIGYPKDEPLSIEGLNAVRLKAGQAYDKASKAGTLITDATYTKNLNAIAQKGTALAKEFPNLAKKDITKMVEGFAGKKLVSSEATVEAIKQLRADSSSGYTSLDPATKAMAKAQGKMADALDGLLYRNLSKTQPEIAPALKAARVNIAKTYTVQKALKGENVNAVGLKTDLKKGKLSGVMKDVAEFAENFPKAAQSNVPQYTTIRPMDYAAGIGGAMIDPTYAVLLAARPTMRSLMLSKPYQALLAKSAPQRMAELLRLKVPLTKIKAVDKLPTAEAQAIAMATMLDDLQESGKADSM